ncbi:aggrecan core protein-like isoform X1 [Mercenaria mercenaria]|uniref:aggrecan core protein-like isoform X1 n=1 Tax=Mercenaria mercenaria TaxID=6596 RepID=UPI00234F67FA|nr:aggrecan core protein-like isoform X1 [Mercenaria mercenaria]
MRLIIIGIFFFCVLKGSDGTRCFECQNVPFPRDCARLTDCNAHEDCFTEQVVTTSGNVVFNSGCLAKSRCSTVSTSLIGKRLANMTDKRSTDIVTCNECCTADYCNMKGCGTLEVPFEQRGPYCYTCDALDPRDCTNVAVCAKHELCMIHTPVEFIGLPETIYRGQCETQSTCDALSEISSHDNCTPVCCSTDFCNDRCGSTPYVNTTALYPHTTDGTTFTMTQVPSTRMSTVRSTKGATTSKPNTLASSTSNSVPSRTTHKHVLHCDNVNGFMLFQNAEAELCIHIVRSHAPLNWHKAREACKRNGADLVVLDTHDKAILLRNELEIHASRYNNNTRYWIGAKDFDSNDIFRWVNGHKLHDQEADWSKNQPDHSNKGADEDCVGMLRGSHPSYTWHDINCRALGNYICEKK